MADDELAEINGVQPKQVLRDGEEIEAKSMTSDSVYKVKRTWDHYYCTCPAWRNQGGIPVNARTCKHLRSILGDKYEDARLMFKNPDGQTSKSAKKKAAAAKGKRKKAATDDEDDEPHQKPGKRLKTAQSSSKPSSRKSNNDKQEDDEESEGDATSPSDKKKPQLLLAVKWDLETGHDPAGWWISEKLDGVRTFYDGKGMLSRLGNPFTPPKWFLATLPKGVTLDGELFGGRRQFQSTTSIVKTINSPHWQNITFQVFDAPFMASEPFEDRLAYLKATFGPSGTHACKHVKVVEHEQARDRDHVLEKLKEIETLGGEGLMLRKPGSEYEGRRSNTLMKVKTFFDAEAIVVGYVPGKGRHKGSTGALKCEMESGKKFSVGSGLNDKQRGNPPKIGTVISYRFQELTRDGVPRFPTFIGVAVDKDKAKDAEVPEHRKISASTGA